MYIENGSESAFIKRYKKKTFIKKSETNELTPLVDKNWELNITKIRYHLLEKTLTGAGHAPRLITTWSNIPEY